MTDADALPRLRAKRAANRGVVTKLIEESNVILENDVTLLDKKTRNRLTRIDGQLAPKTIRPGRLGPTGVFYERFNVVYFSLTNVSPLC